MKTVTLGEMMLRLSPEGHRRFAQAERLEVYYGGGEANVAVALALWGEETRYVTALPSHDFGENAVRFLKGCGVDTSCILRGGERLGIYFAERGAAQRGGRVIYDRRDSAFARSSPEEYDFDRIFDGADFFHITGITPALGENCERLAEVSMREARKRGLTVSFDPNYRASLWSEKEATRCFGKLLPLADILIGSSDGLSSLGLAPTGTDAEKTADAARRLRDRYGFRAVALTMRGHISASENDFSAVLFDGEAHVAPPYRVQIVDRVGAGDAFAAGLIYAFKHHFGAQEAVEFGAAAGALKHTVEGDQALSTKEEISSLIHSGGGRIAR